jgi:N-acetylglucosaminyldiphosphoundecaprenol N-acetyl-beta-D-mannosaminyltransferase
VRRADGDRPRAPTVTVPVARPRAEILGCVFDRLTMAETIARVEEIIADRRPSQLLPISATNVVAVHEDARLVEIMRTCALVSADGQGIVWASRLLHDPLPERVNAADLMEALFPVAERRGYGVYILGAREEVLDRAVANLRQQYPELRIVGYRNGYFGDDENASVIAGILAAQPDMLFVAMSSPRKEYWIAEHKDKLGVPFQMGVGGAVDAVAGLTRRAPLWVRRSGLEWAFRVAQEPRRLFRRFLVGNAKFLLILGRELAGRRNG